MRDDLTSGEMARISDEINKIREIAEAQKILPIWAIRQALTDWIDKNESKMNHSNNLQGPDSPFKW